MKLPKAKVRVYGYVVLILREKSWTAEPDPDYPTLPAHYELVGEAQDRVEFLRDKGLTARVTALLADDGEQLPQTRGE